MKIILGSGIIGLIAKFMLGPEWKIIPFYRSRFFSYNPALDDNFIIRNKKLDPIINQITNRIDVSAYPYVRRWSVAGELVKQYNNDLCHAWLYKIFGAEVPSHSYIYNKDLMDFYVYDLRLNTLYESLIHEYQKELRDESLLGYVTEIGDHYLIRNGQRLDFDQAISTIPLDVLCSLSKINLNLKFKPIHYLHVETEELNFEGANQVLVIDQLIDFFKVTNVAPNRYLFYFHNELGNPGVYLMRFLRRFEILDGTTVEKALPTGQIPKLDNIQSLGIHCIGSYAQWDWCMDVGSCMIRLLKYMEAGKIPLSRITQWH